MPRNLAHALPEPIEAAFRDGNVPSGYSDGDAYRAYEWEADRFAWTITPSTVAVDRGRVETPATLYYALVMESDADQGWVMTKSFAHETLEKARDHAARLWAEAAGLKLANLDIAEG